MSNTTKIRSQKTRESAGTYIQFLNKAQKRYGRFTFTPKFLKEVFNLHRNHGRSVKKALNTLEKHYEKVESTYTLSYMKKRFSRNFYIKSRTIKLDKPDFDTQTTEFSGLTARYGENIGLTYLHYQLDKPLLFCEDILLKPHAVVEVTNENNKIVTLISFWSQNKTETAEEVISGQEIEYYKILHLKEKVEQLCKYINDNKEDFIETTYKDAFPFFRNKAFNTLKVPGGNKEVIQESLRKKINVLFLSDEGTFCRVDTTVNF